MLILYIRKVWHQLLRRRRGSPAHFVTYKILGSRKGGLIGWYAFTLLTFSVTGAVHIIDMGFGIPWYESGSMHFFCVQTLRIMIEDAVHAIYRSLMGDRQIRKSWVIDVFGFLWFLAWASWSMPIWIYPSIKGNTDTQSSCNLAYWFCSSDHRDLNHVQTKHISPVIQKK
jgi:hypothetical protein